MVDWTTQVKSDLEDFNLPSDLEYIQKNLILAGTNLVKKQAKGYELSKLIELKEGENASKLANLSYEKLCQQEYLFKLDVKVAKDTEQE